MRLGYEKNALASSNIRVENGLNRFKMEFIYTEKIIMYEMIQFEK